MYELNVASRNLLNTVRHYITYRDSPYHNTSHVGWLTKALMDGWVRKSPKSCWRNIWLVPHRNQFKNLSLNWTEIWYSIVLFFSGDLYEIGKEKDPVLADMYLEVVYMQRKLEYLLASTVAGLQSPGVEANNHSI